MLFTSLNCSDRLERNYCLASGKHSLLICSRALLVRRSVTRPRLRFLGVITFITCLITFRDFWFLLLLRLIFLLRFIIYLPQSRMTMLFIAQCHHTRAPQVLLDRNLVMHNSANYSFRGADAFLLESDHIP